MNNGLLQLKIKERLNKLASLDYDNFECWQIQEAFNKAQIEWIRRRLHGINQLKQGAEDSLYSVDDVQILLKEEKLALTKYDKYFETVNSIPADYLHFVRVSVKAFQECCPKRDMTVYQTEEANIDEILTDNLKDPSFEWSETVCTLVGGKLRIYTNNKFDLDDAKLTYFRKPVNVEFNGCTNVYTQTVSTADVECELKEDVIEVVVDNAVMILAGDIESMVQYQRASGNVQSNT
jgi:hypothetical protein